MVKSCGERLDNDCLLLRLEHCDNAYFLHLHQCFVLCTLSGGSKQNCFKMLRPPQHHSKVRRNGNGPPQSGYIVCEEASPPKQIMAHTTSAQLQACSSAWLAGLKLTKHPRNLVWATMQHAIQVQVVLL